MKSSNARYPNNEAMSLVHSKVQIRARDDVDERAVLTRGVLTRRLPCGW